MAASILDDEEADPGRNKAKFRVFNTATGRPPTRSTST